MLLLAKPELVSDCKTTDLEEMKYTPYSIWKARAFLLTRRSLETTLNVGPKNGSNTNSYQFKSRTVFLELIRYAYSHS